MSNFLTLNEARVDFLENREKLCLCELSFEFILQYFTDYALAEVHVDQTSRT